MKDQINLTNPAEVRKWEERIYISLEGGKPYMFGATGKVSKNSPVGLWSQHCGDTYEYAKEKVEKWNKENPLLAINVDDIRPIYDTPQYHKSLDGLFRVLRKIGFFTLVGDDSSGFDCYIEKKREWGARAFDTPEDAAFVAICHYLMDVHPTTAEEQERIERNSQ